MNVFGEYSRNVRIICKCVAFAGFPYIINNLLSKYFENMD